MTKLTLKQQRFADEYIISGNAYQSAITAGYSENYAKGNVVKLLENVSVKSYIDERLSEIQSEKIANQEEVMQVLTSVLRGEREEEVVELNKETGMFVKTTKRPDTSAVIRAANEIMKRYPLPKEIKLEANVTTNKLDGILAQLEDDSS
ncbi:terminase small subunit [Streptococcus lutetiensis]|uniref:terminase small subunit n=1 Tax=Streptococcus lutetiensis TaxID=150055 RepID=UPI001BD9D678|nr:terminase small subunit [Streptococcus lutetiensis]